MGSKLVFNMIQAQKNQNWSELQIKTAKKPKISMMGTETEFVKNFENIKTSRRTPNQLLKTKFIRFLVVFLFLMI
jgi:hypothetical protein